MNPSEVKVLIDTYLAAWSEPDPARCRALLKGAWEEDGTYTDPFSHNAGLDELAANIASFHGEFPGARFELEELAHHHQHVHFYWTLRFADGGVQPGQDYGEVSPARKLTKIVGFY